MNQPRKLKKAIKNSIIIYDISAVPNGLDIQELFVLFYTKGVLLYDSLAGDNPVIANRVGKRVKIVNLQKVGA